MILKRYRSFLAVAFCLTGAHAQSMQKLSVTISPIHLAFPVAEITAEYALAPQFGIAGIGGFGSMSAKDYRGKNVTYPVLELGGQASYYLFGSFRHGMQVGAELLWIKIFPPEDQGVTVDVNGIAFGPMVGYKWAARFGLTFMVQAGYEFLFAQAEAENTAGEQAESSAESGVPLVNLNAGWSF